MLKSLEKLKSEIKNNDLRKSNPKILAVSKLQSIEKIENLIRQGQLEFGENYVQEALEKQKMITDKKVKWHLIGPIQSKKIKEVVGKFELIHSVGSIKTARLINEKAHQLNLNQKILLQINLADEDTKNGFSLGELHSQIDELRSFRSISLEGLMTLPPLFENPEDVRPFFTKLRELRDGLALKELSMGTSADYLIAAQEGATIVRVGSLIFGERSKL